MHSNLYSLNQKKGPGAPVSWEPPDIGDQDDWCSCETVRNVILGVFCPCFFIWTITVTPEDRGGAIPKGKYFLEFVSFLVYSTLGSSFLDSEAEGKVLSSSDFVSFYFCFFSNVNCQMQKIKMDLDHHCLQMPNAKCQMQKWIWTFFFQCQMHLDYHCDAKCQMQQNCFSVETVEKKSV